MAQNDGNPEVPALDDAIVGLGESVARLFGRAGHAKTAAKITRATSHVRRGARFAGQVGAAALELLSEYARKE